MPSISSVLTRSTSCSPVRWHRTSLQSGVMQQSSFPTHSRNPRHHSQEGICIQIFTFQNNTVHFKVETTSESTYFTKGFHTSRDSKTDATVAAPLFKKPAFTNFYAILHEVSNDSSWKGENLFPRHGPQQWQHDLSIFPEMRSDNKGLESLLGFKAQVEPAALVKYFSAL